MNMEIYEKLAREHGCTVEEVKRNMQAAIDEAYANPNEFAKSVNPDGRKPTIDEFVAFIVNEIKDEE